MAKILAIETSTDACSAALWLEGKISDRFMVAPSAHTKYILPMVQELLAEAKLDYGLLEAIAFGCGPGGFTGVRLAASITQGLALAYDLPVVRVSTLRGLAQEVFMEFGHPQVIVAQDARMQEVYLGEYRADNAGIMQALTPDRLIKPQDPFVSQVDDSCVGVGNGFKICRDLLVKNCKMAILDRQYVQAKYLAQLAADDFARGLVVSADQALPVYLREKVAWA